MLAGLSSKGPGAPGGAVPELLPGAPPPTRGDMAFTALHWWALQGALQAEEHQKPVAQVQVQECSVRR